MKGRARQPQEQVVDLLRQNDESGEVGSVGELADSLSDIEGPPAEREDGIEPYRAELTEDRGEWVLRDDRGAYEEGLLDGLGRYVAGETIGDAETQKPT